MPYEYDPKIRRYLLIVTIGFFAITALLFVEALVPFTWPLARVGYWIPSIITGALGGYSLFLFIKMPTMDPAKYSKVLGIIELATTPFFLFAMFLSCFLNAKSFTEPQTVWFFIVQCVAIAGQFVLLILFLLALRKSINAGNHGLFPVFNRTLISTVALLSVAAVYVFDIIMGGLVQGVDPADEEALINMLVPFLVILFVHLIVCAIISIVVFVLAFITFIAGVEKRLLGFKGTLKITLRFIDKYEVLFWTGNVITLLLMAIALISAIQVGQSYFALVLLYGTLLLVRIPSFFWKKHIEKQGGDDYLQFRKKHGFLIYSGVWLMLYAVAAWFVGVAGLAYVQTSQTAFMIFVIFIPWALFKSVMGVRGLVIAKKTGEPYAFLKALTDLQVAIATVNIAIFYVANYYRGGRPIDSTVEAVVIIVFLIGLIFALIELGYAVYIGVRLFVMGIVGAAGGRKNYFEKHRQYLVASAPEETVLKTIIEKTPEDSPEEEASEEAEQKDEDQTHSDA